MIRVERVSGGGAAAEWEAFARAQNGFTHFHRYAWHEIMHDVFGHECIYLAARNTEGGLEAVLPLVRVKSMIFGHYLVSMPFMNYGGPIGTDAGVRAVVDESLALARDGDVKLLELRSRVPLPLDLPVSHRKITVLLDLASTPDATLKKFDSKLRSQIRRPQKEGVTVRFGADQVEPFFQVFSQHMRDLGTPTHPKRLFAAVAEKFPEDALIACAYLRGQPIAAGYGLRFGSEIELTWASALREYNRISANMLLYWALMEHAIADGIATFNFGRCSPGSPTHRFKMQWAGREQQLWWYGSSEDHATTPSPDDARFRWGPRVWRHLPTPLATVLGPGIARYIP